MNVMNALEFQSLLKKMGSVSVPELQMHLGLTFSEAKSVRDKLISRCWISAAAERGYHVVRKENLTLRCIEASEREKLCNDINIDCAAALRHLLKNPGADIKSLESAVNGMSDTIDAVAVLCSHRLVQETNERFYLNVSKNSVMVLDEISDLKKLLLRKPGEKELIEERIRKAFDRLL